MAKQLDENSMPGMKSELDFFSLPPTQVSVESGYWAEYRLANPVNNTGPYEFRIERGPMMLDLNRNYVYMKMKIVKADGTDYDGDVDYTVAPINCIGKTFFKQVVVRVSDKEIYNSGSLYAYQAYMETLLNYGWAGKSSHLQNSLFYKDTANQFDAAGAANSGFTDRVSRVTGGKSFELMAPIHCDLFNQERYLLNNTSVNVTLYRNSDAFCLLCFGETEYKIVVEDIRFWVCKVKVQESLGLAVEELMREHRLTAKYPIRRVRMIHRMVASGSMSTSMDALLTGQLPRRIIFGLVSSQAFYGNKGKNPFLFDHNNIKEVVAWVGDRQVPTVPIQTDYPNGIYAIPYMLLHEGSGIGTDDRSLYISYGDFPHGYCFYILDLTPDQSDTASLQLLREGSLALDIRFAQAVTDNQGLELICYAEYDNLITLDYNRQIFFDYSL